MMNLVSSMFLMRAVCLLKLRDLCSGLHLTRTWGNTSMRLEGRTRGRQLVSAQRRGDARLLAMRAGRGLAPLFMRESERCVLWVLRRRGPCFEPI